MNVAARSPIGGSVVVFGVLVCTTVSLWCEVRLTASAEEVVVDGKPFTVFHIAGENLNRPYLHPLRTAAGKVVTRSFPVGQIPGESTDHPHQAGLFYGHGEVNGYNYWSIQNVPTPSARGFERRGRIVLKELVSVKSGRDSGSVEVVLDWLTQGGGPLLTERRTMVFHSHPELRIVDFDFEFAALEEEVVFRDTKEGSFTMRMATVLEERQPRPESGGPTLRRTIVHPGAPRTGIAELYRQYAESRWGGPPSLINHR